MTAIYPDEATTQAVHRFSRGIPSLINAIRENSLIAGHSSQANEVTPAIVQEVAMDLGLEAAPAPVLWNQTTWKRLWGYWAR